MRLVRYLRSHPGFSLVVVLPSLLAAIYYTVFAVDIYESDAQYVVKDTSQAPVSTGISSMLQSAGLGGSSNDSYTVAAYLLSRDALHSLEQSADIRSIYNRPEAKRDFIAKFPNLLYGKSFENLFIHYGYWTEVNYDPESGVSTLVVYAFRPEDAQHVAADLLDLSEALINKLNDRAHADTLMTQKNEVERLQKESIDIQKELTDFRIKQLMIDPNATSAASSGRLASMESDLVSTRTLLSQIEHSSPQSPQLPGLRAHIDSLHQQIAAEEQRSSGGSSSLAPKLSEYEQLLTKQQFIQLVLQTAISALESAEVTVQQQQLYIERVTAPNLADRATHPYRILNFLLVAFSALLIYGIGRLMIAAIREHVVA